MALAVTAFERRIDDVGPSNRAFSGVNAECEIRGSAAFGAVPTRRVRTKRLLTDKGAGMGLSAERARRRFISPGRPAETDRA